MASTRLRSSVMWIALMIVLPGVSGSSVNGDPIAKTRSSWSSYTPVVHTAAVPPNRKFARTAWRLPDGRTYVAERVCSVCGEPGGNSVLRNVQLGVDAFDV